MAKLDYLTIGEAHDLLINKKVTAVELANFYITKIHDLNPRIRAVLTVCEKDALAQANKVDQKLPRVKKLIGWKEFLILPKICF